MGAISKNHEKNYKIFDTVSDNIILCQSDYSFKISIILTQMKAISKNHEKNNKIIDTATVIFTLCQSDYSSKISIVLA